MTLLRTLDAIKLVRKLAKNYDYQFLFTHSKEFQFKFFQNETDLSTIQFHFLRFLNFYSTLYTDIYLKEVDEIVLKNEIYEDAYMYYKQKNKKDKLNTHSSHINKSVDKISEEKSQWNFRKRV
jgi:hypothetical protein